MPETSGGVDIATLGLRVDARQFADASAELQKFAAEGKKVEQASERMGTAADRQAERIQALARANQQRVQAEQRVAQETIQAQEAIDAAHRAHLANREATQRRAAEDERAQAVLQGRERAQADVQAAEQVYREEVARIREAQARGFLNPQDAAQAGRESAEAYNRAVLQTIDQNATALSGSAGREAFTEVAGSLKNVEESGKRAGLGLGRLNETFASLASQAAGTHPVVGRLAGTVGSFAVGSAFMVPVLAGIAALGFAWQEFTRESRKAREEARRSADALLALAKAADMDLRGKIGQDVDASIGHLERLGAAVQRRIGGLAAAETFGGPLAVGLRSLLRKMVDNAEAGYDELQAAIREGEREAQKTLREEGQKYARMLQDQRDEERRIQEERARAFSESLAAPGQEADLFGSAIDTGVLNTVEELQAALEKMQGQAERLRDIEATRTLSMQDQVAAAESRLAIEERTEAVLRRQQTLRDVSGATGRTGAVPGAGQLAVAGGGTVSGVARMPDVIAIAGQIRAQWLATMNLMGKDVEELIHGTDDLSERRQQELEAIAGTIMGVASLADHLFGLEGGARSAVRGVSDLISGISQLESAKGLEGIAGTVAQISGWAGVIGGAVGLLDGLFGGGSQKLEQARERFGDALDDFVDELADASRWERLRADAAEGVQALIDAFIETIDVFEVKRAPHQLREEFENLVEDMGIEDALRRFADIYGGGAAQALDAYLAKLEQIEEQRQREVKALEDDIAIRALVAQGMDAEAEAMQLRLEREAELAHAAETGGDALVALYENLYVLEDAARRAAKMLEFEQLFEDAFQQRAVRTGDFDAQRAAAESDLQSQLDPFRELVEAGELTEEAFLHLATVMRGEVMEAIAAQERAWEHQTDQFMASLEARELALAGDDMGAMEAQLRAEGEAELFRADEMRRAGQISEEAFARLAAVIEGEVVQALQEAERAAREAAAAERFRAMVDTENLRVRLLMAQGMGEEARQLQQTLEVLQAVQDGRGAEYVRLLQLVHAEEDRAASLAKQRKAIEDTNRAIEDTVRVLNRPTGLRLSLLEWGAQAAQSTDSRAPSPWRTTSPVDQRSAMTSGGGGQATGSVDRSVTIREVHIHPPPGEDGHALLRRMKTAADQQRDAGGPDPFVYVPR
jgi:hypothetical protein